MSFWTFQGAVNTCVVSSSECSNPDLSQCDEGLLIDGALLDQLFVLPLQVLDPGAGVPEEDHLLAHGAILLLQCQNPLVVVVQLGVADLGLLPQSLVLLFQQLFVLLQLRGLLLQGLVLGWKRRR